MGLIIELILIGVALLLGFRGPPYGWWNTWRRRVDGTRERVRGTRFGNSLICASIMWVGVVLIGMHLSLIGSAWLGWAFIPGAFLFVAAGMYDHRAS